MATQPPVIRHDTTMPADDLLGAAIEELYSLDPQCFIERRDELATRARRDGDASTARAIGALRRPTKAAWVINRLVRQAPAVGSGLAQLGVQLREAQRSLDGARLRELTRQRRTMIDEATRQALAGQAAPSATLRNEVASTLEAGLADPEVAERLGAGTLVRSAVWSGFGESGTALSAVPPSGAPSPRRRQAAGAATAAATASAAAAAADALAKADEALHSAAAAEREQEEQVGLLADQLADARRRLNEARLRARRARARQQQAQRSVDRPRAR